MYVDCMKKNADSIRSYCAENGLTFEELSAAMGFAEDDLENRKELSYAVYGMCSDEEKDRIMHAAARAMLAKHGVPVK